MESHAALATAATKGTDRARRGGGCGVAKPAELLVVGLRLLVVVVMVAARNAGRVTNGSVGARGEGTVRLGPSTAGPLFNAFHLTRRI